MKKSIYCSLVFFLFLMPLRAEINIYFSHSVDTTLANPYKAKGYSAFDEKLIKRIMVAQYSIDFCFYNIKRQNIVDSLLAAFNRGIDVRVITENEHIANPAVQDIINAGIPVIDDTFGNNQGESFMHNKFAIFDFRDSTSVSDDWVWTGSYNITDEGTESNANNVIEIQHNGIARAYTMEFEEMWGSKTDTPDSLNSKFSYLKTDNTEHNFLVDSIPVQIYFSPSDHSTSQICNAIATADSTIYFSIFAFTRQDVCDDMKVKWASGISVKGIFDNGDWYSPISKSQDMRGGGTNPWSPPAPVFCDSVNSSWGPRMLHHKYMLIDADCNSEPVVVTGSQNWSNNGELHNDENTLIIQSQNITNQYLQEFVERYREAGGEYTGITEERQFIPAEMIKVFPNPFSQKTVIQLTVNSSQFIDKNRQLPTGNCQLQIYDVSGRLIRTFNLCNLDKSVESVYWDGRNDYGEKIHSGIYVIKINEGEYEETEQLLLLK